MPDGIGFSYCPVSVFELGGRGGPKPGTQFTTNLLSSDACPHLKTSGPPQVTGTCLLGELLFVHGLLFSEIWRRIGAAGNFLVTGAFSGSFQFGPWRGAVFGREG